MRNQQPVTVAVPGTCGELVQGWHPNWERPVLVSCPIHLHSRVRVSLNPTGQISVCAAGPGNNAKLRQAARLALDFLGRRLLGAEIWVDSQLLPGRGMASSTADVVGVMAALSLGLQHPLAPEQLAGLACQIEPSDSTMFTNPTALAYRNGEPWQELGTVRSLPLLMLDPGQIVDTLAFNATLNLPALKQLGPGTQTALQLLQQGLAANHPEAIGQAASLSAFNYQTIAENPLLERAKRWATATGALGLVRAHSGSLVGLLYPPETPLAGPGRWLAGQFEGTITATMLAPGGFKVVQ